MNRKPAFILTNPSTFKMMQEVMREQKSFDRIFTPFGLLLMFPGLTKRQRTAAPEATK